jgi:hypothetical protein
MRGAARISGAGVGAGARTVILSAGGGAEIRSVACTTGATVICGLSGLTTRTGAGLGAGLMLSALFGVLTVGDKVALGVAGVTTGPALGV